MSIAVLEVELGADGIWQADLPDIRKSADLETVPSLDGFSITRASVRIGDNVQTLDVFEKGELAFVRLDALTS
jgi:hypothetical protein